MDTAFEKGLAARLGGRSRTLCAGALLSAVAAFAFGSGIASSPYVVHAETRAAAGTPAAPVVVPAVTKPARPSVLRKLTGGMASWYGEMFQSRKTASGRRFEEGELTAAHRSLPFGSRVKVTDLRNRRSVVVTITDRGLVNHADRVIDLSYAAAEKLDMVRFGVDPVSLELMQPMAMARVPVLAHP